MDLVLGIIPSPCQYLVHLAFSLAGNMEPGIENSFQNTELFGPEKTMASAQYSTSDLSKLHLILISFPQLQNKV
jgi:hypothetical protein